MTDPTKEPVMRMLPGSWKHSPDDVVGEIRRRVNALEVDGVSLREILKRLVDQNDGLCHEYGGFPWEGDAVSHVFGLDEEGE